MNTATSPSDDYDAILRTTRADLANPAMLEKNMDQYLKQVIVYIKQPETVHLAKNILELFGERALYYLQFSRYHKAFLPRGVEHAASNALYADDSELFGFFAEWLARYYFMNGSAFNKPQESLLWTVETSIIRRTKSEQPISVTEQLRLALDLRYIKLFNRLKENFYPESYENLEQYRACEDVSLIEKMRIDLTLAIEDLVNGQWNGAIQKAFGVKQQLGNQATYLASGIHRQDAITRRYQYFANLLCSIGYLQQGNYDRARHYQNRAPQSILSTNFIYHDIEILSAIQAGCLSQKAGQFDDALKQITEAKLNAEKMKHRSLVLYTHYALAAVFIDMEQLDMANEVLDSQLRGYKQPRNTWYAANFYYMLAYSKSHVNNKLMLAKQHLTTAKNFHAKLNPSSRSSALNAMILQAEQTLTEKQPILTKPLMLIPPIVVI